MNRKTKLIRSLGALFLFAAFVLAFGWFYWLAPVKHIFSSAWWDKHSHQAYWEEAQKSVYRIGVTHDVGIEMERCGDKKWATWIIHHIKPGQHIGGCEHSHLGEALAGLTNHQLPPEADIWLAWWTTNQNKSQIEWIREGFAERGIILQQPLTTNNIIDLLKLFRSSTNSAAEIDITGYARQSLRENAFRWLRDAGFYPQGLYLKDIPEKDKDQVIVALIGYAQWYGEHWNDPGKLPIRDNSDYSTEPWIMAARVRWTLYSVMTALAITGFWLVRFTLPSKNS